MHSVLTKNTSSSSHLPFFWTAFILLLFSSTSSALLGGRVDEERKYNSAVKLDAQVGRGCSAVRISETFYLSAAHCFNDLELTTTRMSVPQFMIQSHEHVLTGTLKSVNLHPTWRKNVKAGASFKTMAKAINSGKVSDLALVEMVPDPDQTAVNEKIWSARVMFVPMLVQEMLDVTIGGYGENDLEVSEDQKMKPIYGDVKSRTYSKDSPFYWVSASEEALGETEKNDLDNNTILLRSGDSGGPVYYEDHHGVPIIVGINSGGSSVGLPNEVGVIARVDIAKDWLCSLVALPNCK